jgi:hypothetical protein
MTIALKNHLRLGTRLRQGFAGQAASPSIRDFPSIPHACLEGEPVVSRVFQRNPMSRCVPYSCPIPVVQDAKDASGTDA